MDFNRKYIKHYFAFFLYIFLYINIFATDIIDVSTPFRINVKSETRDKTILILYNKNSYIEYPVYDNDIINIHNLEYGLYEIRSESSGIKSKLQRIQVSKPNASLSNTGKIITVNIDKVKDSDHDFSYSSHYLSDDNAYFKLSTERKKEISINRSNISLINPLDLTLYAKYNIIFENNINDVFKIRLLNELGSYSHILQNIKLPVTFWQETVNSESFVTQDESGQIIVNYSNTDFQKTFENSNYINAKHYPNINYIIDQIMETSLGLNLGSNIITGINLYMVNNEQSIIKYKNILNEDIAKEFKLYTLNEAKLIKNILNFLNKTTTVLDNINFTAKADLISVKDKILSSEILVFDENLVDTNSENENLTYMRLIMSVLKHYYTFLFKDSDNYKKFLDTFNWVYDENQSSWKTNMNKDSIIKDFDITNPQDEFALLTLYYIINSKYPDGYLPNIEFLNTCLPVKRSNINNFNRYIKTIDLDIDGGADKNKEINFTVQVKSKKDTSLLEIFELTLVNEFGEILNLEFDLNDNVNRGGEYSLIRKTLTISKSKKSAVYFIDSIRINYQNELSINEFPVYDGLAFAITNQFEDIIPPQIVFETFQSEVNQLSNGSNRISISFNVIENHLMAEGMNTFIQLKAPGNRNLFIDLFGYGIDEGDNGYFSNTGRCMVSTLLPDYFPSGNYLINSIELYDENNNVSYYNENIQDFEKLNYDILIDSGNSDFEPPEIDNDNIRILKLNNDNGEVMQMDNIVIFLNVIDKNAGIKEANFVFENNDGSRISLYSMPDSQYLESNILDDKDFFNSAFPLYSLAEFDNYKNYKLSQISVSDNVNNTVKLENLSVPIRILDDNNNINVKSLKLNYAIKEGKFGVYFKTTKAQNILQTSSDLTNWMSLQLINGDGGVYYYLDNEKLGKYKYYRVIEAP